MHSGRSVLVSAAEIGRTKGRCIIGVPQLNAAAGGNRVAVIVGCYDVACGCRG